MDFVQSIFVLNRPSEMAGGFLKMQRIAGKKKEAEKPQSALCSSNQLTMSV